MQVLARSLPGRFLAALLALASTWLGCELSRSLGPSAGVPQYQRAALVSVPGGFVNAAGGNLLVERLDLSIDTIFGTQEILATYNARSGEWLWSFQIRYDGATYVDPSGALHDVSGLADGEAIPGTVWVRADADSIETKGGLAHHFGAAGRLDHVAWRSADYPRIQYAWQGSGLELASCTQPSACQTFFAIALDVAGRPQSLTDTRTGRFAEFGWDDLGRLESARGPHDVEAGRPGFQYEYGTGSTLLTAITNSEGERIEYAYQTRRRIREVKQVGEESPRHEFRFQSIDAEGLFPTLYVDPLGAQTRYLFDAERRLRRLERLETGESLHYAWGGKRVTRSVLPNGVATLYSYEGDELASVVAPSGNVIAFSYEPGALNFDDIFARPIRRIDDSLGPIEEREYDALGRPVRLRNGEGESRTIEYFTGSTVASITGPDGVGHAFPRYGVHGHWLERTGARPDERVLDPVGNALVPASLDRGGGVLTRGYDGARRLVSLEVAATQDGRVTGESQVAIRRRSDGRLTAVERPGGGDHQFAFDSIGRLVERRERVDGLWQATTFEHDAAGRLTARALPNGMREEFAYDPYGRLEHHRALRDGEVEGESFFTYADGDLVAVYDSLRGAAEVYAYDDAGRRKGVWFAYGETLELYWDLRSRLAREVFSLPGQGVIRTVDHAYDLADRRIAVRLDETEPILERVYAQGRLVSTRYGNGLVRELAYDPQTGLLARSTTANALGERVESMTLERSVEEGPARSQIAVATETPLASTGEEYWIGLGTSPSDPDQRVGKRVFGFRDEEGASLAFAYDVLGNRSDAGSDRFVYNAEANRLLSATPGRDGETLDYSWDAAGFATSRAGAAIEWTATGRLAAYGALRIEWDMRGRPISWTADGVERDFSLFGGRVERDPETGVLGALDLGEVAVHFGGARRYRHFDFRGNVSFVSDELGAVVAHYAYSPYGLDAVFGADEDGVTFLGRHRIGELVLLGARAYDPAVGRFLSPDPVFQLRNQYGYAGGNPVWFADPDGRDGEATGADVAVTATGLAIATATLFTLGPEASAAAAILGGAGFTLAVVVFGMALAAWINGRSSSGNPTPAASPTGSGPGAARTGPSRLTGASPKPVTVDLSFAAPPPPACAPTRVGAVPDLGWLLYLLVPLQLAAALALLRRRAEARVRRPEA